MVIKKNTRVKTTGKFKSFDFAKLKKVLESYKTSLIKNSTKYWRRAVVGVLVIFLIISGVGFYRAYRLAATDNLTLFVARIWHLPVGKINGHFLSYADYIDDTKFYLARTEGAKTNSSYKEQISDKVLKSLANNYLAGQLAKEQGVEISKQELQTEVDQLLAQFGGKNNFKKEILNSADLSLSQYQDKFIKPSVIQNKLATKFSNDTAARDMIKSKANEILQKIKSGEDFASLAKQYSQDDKSSKGGDLGWFGYGIMVPQVESALENINPGEVYPQVVESMFGYHIIKLEEKSSNPQTDQAGVWHARQILLRLPSLQQTLDDKIKTSEIKIYPRMHNPFSNN